MAENRSIVFIITGLSTGGAEMALYRLLSRLSHAYTPQVISLTTVGEIGVQIQQLGIPVKALGMKAGINSLLCLVRLVNILKTLKPDLVHTWMYHADLVGGVAARLAGLPVLVWAIRNSDLSPDKTRWTTRAVVRMCALLSRYVPNKITSCSYRARDIHTALGYDASRFVVIPNGFDLERFRPNTMAYAEVRQELGLSVNARLIGLVGRFHPQKNHTGFLQAARMLHDTFPDVHFILAGTDVDGKNRSLVESLQPGLFAQNVHLLGLRKDMPRLTAAFDVACSFSSWGEAFPNVVGEAMACGVPCAVTDVGDAAYIVGDTGKIVAINDAPGLTGALSQLLLLSQAERSALGDLAQARVAELFEIGRVVSQYEALYDELLDGR